MSLIKLFELEVSVRKMALQLNVSYRAVYGAVTTIRLAILSHAEDAQALLDGEVELDEAYFGGRRKGNRGRGAAGKVSVFGILERDGLVHVNVVPDVSAATLLKLTVKKVRRGSVVYTDKFRSYDSLMFCGYRHLKVDHGKYFSLPARSTSTVWRDSGVGPRSGLSSTMASLKSTSRFISKNWSSDTTIGTMISSIS